MSQITKSEIETQVSSILNQDVENKSLEEMQIINSDLAGLFSTSHKNRLEVRLTDEQLEKWDYLRYLISREENKNEIVKVGDMFHTSWGYDQTNTEYFKVKSISKSGKSCEVVMVSFETVPGSEGYMCDSITPIPEKEIHNGETCTVRINKSSIWNPRTKSHEKIGSIHLRGSVFIVIVQTNT